MIREACPCCGKTFNVLQCVTGGAKEHIINCRVPEKRKDLSYLADACRGCPANFFEKGEFTEKGVSPWLSRARRGNSVQTIFLRLSSLAAD